jgi:hypothetical protein
VAVASAIVTRPSISFILATLFPTKMQFIQQENIIVPRGLSSFLRGAGATFCTAMFVLRLIGGTPVAWSRDLHVTVLDAPPGQSIEVHAVSPVGQLGGQVKDQQGTHGLLCQLPCNAQAMRSIDLWFNGEKAVSTQIRTMAIPEQIAGSVVDRKGDSHGFVCGGVSSTLRCRQIDVTIHDILMTDTLIFGMQEPGDLVGSYRDKQAKIHGFLFRDDSFQSVEVPQAIATVVTAIGPSPGGNAPTLTGFFVDAGFAIRGFLCQLPIRPQCFRPFDVTLDGVPQTMTHPTALTGTQLVGSFRDKAGESHGFQCRLPVRPECFIQLDVPQGKHTEIFGANERGQLVGQYDDNTGRPRAFVAHTP